MYAITRNILTGSFALVGKDQRFDFSATDGPLIADMFNSEFPSCMHCDDRENVCESCGTCESCATCPDCEDDDDEDDEDDGEDDDDGEDEDENEDENEDE